MVNSYKGISSQKVNFFLSSMKAMISCRKIAESSLRVQFYVSRLMEALGEFRYVDKVWQIQQDKFISGSSGGSHGSGDTWRHYLEEFRGWQLLVTLAAPSFKMENQIK